jgi:hypothetical protein
MLTLVRTCHACPEQYDVFSGNDKVGYLRLRHGYFRAENAAKDIVLEGNPIGDGMFTDGERDKWLRRAVAAIEADLIDGKGPEVEYEVREGEEFYASRN